LRKIIDARPADRPRMPPGQFKTDKWPVLHYGSVPKADPEEWTLKVCGCVDTPLELNWSEILSLPEREVLCDLHCVTQWSRLDNRFTGVAVSDATRAAGIRPEASHALVHGPDEWSANLPLSDLLREDVLLAHSHDGAPLTAEHGGPLRLIVPHLYLWKSAKWVTRIEFLSEDRPGLWERNGYHMRGDPWKEERFCW